MSNHNACALIMNKRIKPIAVGLDIPALSCAQKNKANRDALRAAPALIAEGSLVGGGKANNLEQFSQALRRTLESR